MRVPHQANDAEIIAASVTEPELFGRIVDAYSDVMLGYLSRRVGLPLAQDMTSETFLLAFRARHTYRPLHETAKPWLYGIATNRVRDHGRSERRRIDALGRLAGQAAFSEQPEDRVDEAMAAAATLQCLSGGFRELSHEARDVLVLIAIEDLSYEETATALGIPIGTVRSRLSRARRDLRRSLAGLSNLQLHDVSECGPQEGNHRG